MACNCGKRKGTGTKTTGKGTKKIEEFVLQTEDGRTQTFGSRLEAVAARERAGGTGTIRPVVR